jgi:DNA-binding CsgD family transcriptional regulator
LKGYIDGYFSEIGENMAVQHVKDGVFSSKESGMGPSYRKVDAYSKSLKQYRLERKRRRQVRVLAFKGYTQQQIAVELGVSVRTVKRDWEKVRAYVKGQHNKTLKERASDEIAVGDFEKWSQNLTHKERDLIIKRLSKQPKRKQTLIVYLNMDKQNIAGFPYVTTYPAMAHFSFSGKLVVKIRMIRDHKTKELLNFVIGQ